MRQRTEAPAANRSTCASVAYAPFGLTATHPRAGRVRKWPDRWPKFPHPQSSNSTQENTCQDPTDLPPDLNIPYGPPTHQRHPLSPVPDLRCRGLDPVRSPSPAQAWRQGPVARAGAPDTGMGKVGAKFKTRNSESHMWWFPERLTKCLTN